MGLTIRCKKTKDEIDVGYFGFKRLREKVSELVGGDWHMHYLELLNYFPSCDHSRDLAFYKAFDEETERLISSGSISEGIADFLMQPDCGGSIPYEACKKIWKTIGNYNNNSLYGYRERKNTVRFVDFKRIVWICVDKKCDMVWR